MIWTWIEAHPTLTVGVLGFGGVIYTLWFNADQVRKLRREEQQNERQAMRTALLEELKISLKGIEKNVEKHSPPNEPRDVTAPTDILDDVYQAFTNRIGMLSPEEVQKVMLAYLSIRQANSLLFVIGTSLENTDRQVLIPADKIPRLLTLYKTLIGPINDAIQVLGTARNAD